MEFLRIYSPERLLPTLLAGLVAGVVTMVTSVSFAALIFNGKLAPFVSTGISILITTAIVAGCFYSVLSACRPLVSMPDDDTAPVLALLVTLVVASFPDGASAETVFVTAFAVLALSTVLTGVSLTFLGMFRLGSLIRYLPYSVMGGYFAGAGLLLIQGALRVVSDLSLDTSSSFVDLLEPDLVWRWLPALISAVIIRLIFRFVNQSLAMPVSIVLLIAGFYVLSIIAGYPASRLMSDGWLMGPFPDIAPSFWNPVLIERSGDIHWRLVLDHLGSIGTIILLSAVSLMLTASGLSLLQQRNLDINRELIVAGLTNSVSGLNGGLVALPSINLTSLAMTVGAPASRMVGLLVALVCAAVLYGGLPLVAWLPKPVLAGILMYLGWSFLERWLIRARHELPLLEYLVVVVIVLVVAAVGFLQGVLMGLLAAVVLFVVNYSRINVVRYALSGSQRKSNVERNRAEEKFLREEGGQTLILQLQGYLFFGTVAALGDRIEERQQDKSQPTVRYVLLDFAQVTGLDASGVLSFVKLAQEAARSGFVLVLTGLSSDATERLVGSWVEHNVGDQVQIFPDIDRGVEWCEEQILKRRAPDAQGESIMEQLRSYLPNHDDQRILLEYLEHREVARGDVLASQGEPSEEMFLLESCAASVYLGHSGEEMHRLRRARSGTVFGEVGFYLGTPRTATVIVDRGGDMFVLHKAANEQLQLEHQHIGAALQRFMLQIITRRLLLTTATLEAVLD